MKYLIYLLAIIIVLGINLGLFNNLQIKGQIPNLLLLMTIYFAFEKGSYDFFFIAFVSGLLLDFFSTGFFGCYTLAFLLFAFCLHIFVANMVMVELSWKTLMPALIGSLLILDFFVWFYGLLAFKFSLAPDYVSFKVFTGSFLPAFFYNLLLLYPVCIFSATLKKFVDNLSLRRRGVVR